MTRPGSKFEVESSLSKWLPRQQSWFISVMIAANSCYCNESHVCTQMQGSGHASRVTKSRPLQYPNDVMRVATKSVAWLHNTGHNAIQLLYGIFSLNDKVFHVALAPLYSNSFQGNKVFNWGWKTKTCLNIRMSKPSARKPQLCNIKHTELCAQNNLIIKYYFLDLNKNISTWPLELSGERHCISAMWK